MSSRAQKNIQLAAKLYDARDTIKRLWGEGYAERIKVPIAELKAAAERGGTDIMTEALSAAKHFAERYEGGAALIIIAAAVEITEPSE